MLLLPGIGLLLFAAAWYLSNEARIREARGIDRQDQKARTQTGIPSPYGGSMSVTFGQPSNEARVAETKRDDDLPKIFVLAVSGGGVFLAGVAVSVLRWLRTARAPVGG